ncbi:hypothetical protein SPRG_08394 [Saprolegnia parasitica CBS 223.65]|uniref:Choline transporter-like protein n=1 Tax=Saprolegnia parasitica (strain CBS 223.65) TaxID=695850 RepID=A0A067CIG1_SAPPC|nr:hypothetical protein SPRG_08394 [Saprolegnia parasitica CBS 223.65]KDO26321.1 hypothetical protein SPRG_08394 [Saprolegnia parasitica CBS 223.65]|eukprot:XP_012203020.1 hypothetical protein SPRG_08394 [Saprolegnia parasitica CBS 223.65]
MYQYQSVDQQEPMLAGDKRGGPAGPVQSMRRETATAKCNDGIFALLFIGHLVAIAYFAFTKGLDFINQYEKDHPAPEAQKGLGVVLGVSGGLIGVSVLFSAIWMKLLMAFAEHMIKFALWTNVGLLFGFAVVTLFVNPIMPFIFLFLAAINICYIYAVQNRIGFASANLKIACSALNEYVSIFGVAIFLLVIQVIWVAVWGLSTVGVYQMFRTADPHCAEEEARGKVCGGSGFGVTMFFLLVSVFWGQQVVQNVLTTTAAGTVASWWYHSSPTSGVGGALYRSMTSSFGSICFGSLIVAVLSAMRTMARVIRNQAQQDDNAALACVACLAECVLNCIENIMEYFNQWAYTYVGIYGFDFRTSGKAVIDLFNNRGWTAVINDDLASTALTIGAFGVGILSCCLGLLVAQFAPIHWQSQLGANMDQTTVFVIFGTIGFIAGVSMAMILANLVITALHTIFVCFAEDPMSFQRAHPEHYSELVMAWRHFQPDALVTAYGSYV